MVNDLLDLEEHHAKAQRAQRIDTWGVLAFFASWREPFRLSTTSLTSTEILWNRVKACVFPKNNLDNRTRSCG